MKLLLFVHGPGDDWPHSDFALLSLPPEYAARMLRLRTAAETLEASPERPGAFLDIRYFDQSQILWLGHDEDPRSQLAAAGEHAEPGYEDVESYLEARLGPEAIRDFLLDQAIVVLPDSFEISRDLADATDMDQVLVSPKGVRYRTYLKHLDCGSQETDEIPWSYFEQASATPPAAA